MSTVKQLSGQDTSFLFLDNERASSGGTMIYVYDQSTVSGGKLRFKDILTYIESRLDSSPVFKRKLKKVPLHMDHPYWVTDENFSLEHHVHHVALPKPGDWRQFCIMAARLTKPHFDLERPLWEMFVVEGLDNVDWLPKGSFAILTRVHHAAIDGTAAAEITWGLHEIAADIRTHRAQYRESERLPGLLEMATRALWNNITTPVKLMKPLMHVLPAATSQLLNWAGKVTFDKQRDTKVEMTRFNTRVSPYRVYTSCRLSLDDMKRIKHLVPGSTINDVVVAIVGGAIRIYLDHHQELPAESLVALMPINTRGDTSSEQGAQNQIAMMTAAIGSDQADPLLRLEAVHQATSKSKAVMNGIGAKDLTDINRHAPAALLAAASRLVASTGVDGSGIGRPYFNLGISNVPGPNVPLYFCGAKLKYWSVVAPILDGLSAAFAVTSYDGELVIAPTACREVVPDPDFLLECIEKSYGEFVDCLSVGVDEVAASQSMNA